MFINRTYGLVATTFEVKKIAKIKFTPRQLEVMKTWSASPQTTKIAEELHLSKHTVLTHLKRMRKKLGVSRTFDVYLYLKKEELL